MQLWCVEDFSLTFLVIYLAYLRERERFHQHSLPQMTATSGAGSEGSQEFHTCLPTQVLGALQVLWPSSTAFPVVFIIRELDESGTAGQEPNDTRFLTLQVAASPIIPQ